MHTGTVRQRADDVNQRHRDDELVAAVRAVHDELRQLRHDLDRIARVYLNAHFPYGKPDDPWGPR